MAVKPFTTVARTTTVPAAVPVKVFPEMVAAAPLTRDHVIVLFVAFAGFTVPVSVSGVPTVAVVGTPVIEVTGTDATVMVKSLVYAVVADAPLAMVARTTIVPAAEAVIVFPLNVAATPLTRLHVMVLLVALAGTTVPERVSGVPTVAVVGTSVMLVTGMCAAVITISNSFV